MMTGGTANFGNPDLVCWLLFPFKMVIWQRANCLPEGTCCISLWLGMPWSLQGAPLPTFPNDGRVSPLTKLQHPHSWVKESPSFRYTCFSSFALLATCFKGSTMGPPSQARVQQMSVTATWTRGVAALGRAGFFEGSQLPLGFEGV